MCNHSLCCNPAHLDTGTHIDNSIDMIVSNRHFQKNQTHCLRNHELTEDNVKYSKISLAEGKEGLVRNCKKCAKIRELAYRNNLPKISRLERLYQDVVFDFETGCHLAMRGLNHKGYASARLNGKKMGAHLVSLLLNLNLSEAPLDEDGNKMIVRHSIHCQDNKNCINSDHLQFGTHKENSMDTVLHGRHPMTHKTHCPLGHPYEGDNLYIAKNGSRHCKICTRMSDQKYKTKKKAAGEMGEMGDYNRNKTHCPRGHAYEGDNLIINSKNSRVCRECRNISNQNHRQKRKKDSQ